MHYTYSMNENYSELIEYLGSLFLFNDLEEQELEIIADQFNTILVNEGQIIFKQGSDSDFLYFILKGKVILEKEHFERTPFAILNSGDIFGSEIIFNQPHKVTAKASSNGVLLQLSKEQLISIFAQFPNIKEKAAIIGSSYQLQFRIPMDWCSPREVIQFIARKHPLFLIVKMITPGLILGLDLLVFFIAVFSKPDAGIWTILAILLAVIGIVWMIWNIADWSNDYSIITNRRVVSLNKIAFLYESRREAPLEAVLSSEIRTQQLGRIFLYGDLAIRTYTGFLYLLKLKNPQLVESLLIAEKNRNQIRNKQSERSQTAQIIAGRIGYTSSVNAPQNEPVNHEEEVTTKVKSGKLSDFLSSLFLLRTEESGEITYRTHWAILLKKTRYPLLIGLVLFGVLFLSLVKIITFLPFINVLVICVIGGVLAAGWWFYRYIDWRNDRYIVTHDQIIDIYKKPLGQENRRSAPIKNIQTVEFKRLGLISLILNYGTVLIRVGDTTFTFDYVYNPSEVQREILERYHDFNQAEKQKVEELQRQRMADWIEIYHNLIQNKNSGFEPPPDSGYNIPES